MAIDNEPKSLKIYRGGPKRDTWSSCITLEPLNIDLDKDALLLSSPSEVTFIQHGERWGKTPPPLHVYGITVPLKTARAIVEAYCKKLADSPEIAAKDEQLSSLAPALVRLLHTIIC